MILKKDISEIILQNHETRRTRSEHFKEISNVKIEISGV